jgi:hypothetical protein
MSASFCLPRPQRRKPTAAILPLINVVFLLLMFIVLAGVIRTPDPFALTPPSAAEGERADAADPDTTLFVSPPEKCGSGRWPARTPSWQRWAVLLRRVNCSG